MKLILKRNCFKLCVRPRNDYSDNGLLNDGIFEFRVDDSGKYYRLFAFWDTEEDEMTLVVPTHGLIKKTNKTPLSEIQKAEQIKREYFEEKKRDKMNKSK